MELENLIKYMDDDGYEPSNSDLDDSKVFGKDTFEDSEVDKTDGQSTDQSTDQSTESTSDNNPDASNVNTNQVDSGITTPPPPDNADEKPTSNYEEYFNILKDSGILAINDDFQFDGTAEGIIKAIEQTNENLPRMAFQSLWNNLPEDWQQGLEYALQGGKIENYINSFHTKSLDVLDVQNSAEDQREVLRQYYKKTTPHSDEKIAKFIDRIYAMGDLEEEASTAYQELKQLEKAERDNLIVKQNEERQRQLEEARETRENIISVINSSSIENPRKTKVQAFLFNPIKIGNNEPTTQFQAVLSNIGDNPQHLVELADFLLDSYDTKKGFNWERINKKLGSGVTKTFKERLESLNNPSNLGGSSSLGSKSNFDLEAFLAQN